MSRGRKSSAGTGRKFGGAQSVAAISLFLVVPLVGRAIHLFGIRRIAITSMLLFSASTFSAVYLTGSIWMLHGLMVLFAVTGGAARMRDRSTWG